MNVEFPLSPSIPVSQSRRPVGGSVSLHPRRLLTPRRLDLAVKWRFFRHLLGGADPDSERVYRWHIRKRSETRMQIGLPTDQWKRSVDDYVIAAASLFASMQTNGFNITEPIPIDPVGELLGGAHRLACARALDVNVHAQMWNYTAWAPAWDYAWFADNGMTGPDLIRLLADWVEMRK